MARQLSLIETPKPWRLDERTKAIGRRGLASARAALAASAPEHDGDDPDAHRHAA